MRMWMNRHREMGWNCCAATADRREQAWRDDGTRDREINSRCSTTQHTQPINQSTSKKRRYLKYSVEAAVAHEQQVSDR